MVILVKILIPIANFIYFFFKIFPVKDRILFISRQSDTPNEDFKLLGNILKKKHEVIYLCKTLDGGIKAKKLDVIKYCIYMLKQMYYLSTSKICIVDTYNPAVCMLKHKKSLKIIQIWHSIGTMKKFGYSALDKKEGSKAELAYAMKMHNNYDIIYASSKNYVEDLCLGFNCSRDKIKIRTLPRVDILMDSKKMNNYKEKIYKRYPILKEKINVLYAPTFRKDESNFAMHLNELIDNFDFKKYNLILKLHPLSKLKISNNKVIIDDDFSTLELLSVTDKMISDYSCVIYEAGILNIPLYFYCYDLKNYEIIRGLAIDYSTLPGFKCANAKELITSLDYKYDYSYLKQFIKKYVSNTRNCTKLIVEDIEKLMYNKN